jgi:hypothetical protein
VVSVLKRADEVLAKLLELRGTSKGELYSSLFGGWPLIAGLSLADHSRVYDLKNGSLFVEVDHPGWMQLLLIRKAPILQRVKRRFPELKVQDLRVRVNLSYAGRRGGRGEGPQEPGREARQEAAGQAAPAAPGAANPEEGAAAEVESLLAGVQSEELRRRLRRLFESSIGSRGRGRGDPGERASGPEGRGQKGSSSRNAPPS